MRTIHLSLFFAMLLLLASCISEPLGGYGDDFGDGTPTRITLAVTGDSRQGGVPQTRAAALVPADEGLISNLQVLVFDADGAVLSNECFDKLNGGSDGASNITTEIVPGKDRQIYVIANSDVNDKNETETELHVRLNAVKTLAELNALLVNVKDYGLGRTDRLTMVGNATVTIAKPQKEAIPITLRFLTAKVTVTVKDNIAADKGSIAITGWDVANIPKRTYLCERAGENQADAVTGSKADDYTTTNSEYEFATQDTGAKTWTQSFYVFENRRGGRVNRADPENEQDKYPGMNVADTDQRGKGWYAPVGATYMLIYGTYTQDGRTNNVIYKIYLGENEVNDYNLWRGKHYTFNISINGLNDIDVDTNVEWGNSSFTVTRSTNMQMDAHPDFRVLRIGGTAESALLPAYATVEVLNADGTTPCDWLMVSPLNLYRHGVKQATGEHQQFDSGNGQGSFVRARYVSTPTDESTLANATFGMTRKLTEIPFGQLAVYSYQNVMVYADAYAGTGERKGKVRVTYFKGADGKEEVGQQTFDISQSGAIKLSDDLYMECYEESAMLMHPGLASELQSTTTMQWGYNDALLYGNDDRYSNGNYLTANAVYKTVETRNQMEAPTWSATTYDAYRAKYPRTGEQVAEPSLLSVTKEGYFYPILETATSPSDYFHPIYNSSAARYCHEKNRDTNGDGVIDASETVWYLPSLADMVSIAKNLPTGINLTGTYWTATEAEAAKSWAYTFAGDKSTTASVDKLTTQRVRCVRGRGIAELLGATIKSTEEDKTQVQLAYKLGSSGAFTITDESGLTWTATTGDDSWLKLATTSAGGNAAASVTGTGTKTYYAYATSNYISDTDFRTTNITLTRAAMSNQVLTIKQTNLLLPDVAAHKGWAGSHIYWLNGKLTFEPVNSVSGYRHYQGAFFKWGSLVALGTQKNFAVETEVKRILFSPSGKKDWKYADIPSLEGTIAPVDEDKLIPPALHDVTKEVGDICKYITAKGWAPSGNWRMPTAAECRVPFKNTNEIKMGTRGTYVTASNHEGRWVVAYRYEVPATGLHSSVQLLLGGRMDDKGVQQNTGIKGYLWSGSYSSSSQIGVLTAEDYDGFITYPYVRSWPEKGAAMPVRCVKE